MTNAKLAPKRPPGRPKGSKNNSEKIQINVETVPKRGRGRPPKDAAQKLIEAQQNELNASAREIARRVVVVERERDAAVAEVARLTKLVESLQAALDAGEEAELNEHGEPFKRVPLDCSPLDYLEGVTRGIFKPDRDRMRAAIASARYRHTARDDGGKKEQQADEAAKATQDGSKFAPQRAPRGAQLQ